MIITLYQVHILIVSVTLILLTWACFERFSWAKWSIAISAVMLAVVHYYVGYVELRWIGTILILWGFLRVNGPVNVWRKELQQLLMLVSTYLITSQIGYTLLNVALPTSISRSPLRFLIVVNMFNCLLMGIGFVVVKRRNQIPRMPVCLVIGAAVATLYLIPPLRYSRIITANIEVDSTLLYQFLAAFALVVLSINVWTSYRTRQKLKKQAEAQLIHYAQDIEALYNNVAMFRHDYLNILHSLQLSIDQENWQEVVRIFHDTIAPTQKLLLDQSYEFGKLGRIGTLELKSLLHAKLVYAQSKGLTIQLDIPQSLPEIAFDKVVLVRAVAILLDNAIEAAVDSDEKTLAIALFDIQGVRHIHVINSSAIQEWTYKPKYTTKGTAQEHGWGLYYLHQLTQQDERVQLVTDVSDGLVYQQLMIDPSVTSIHLTVK